MRKSARENDPPEQLGSAGCGQDQIELALGIKEHHQARVVTRLLPTVLRKVPTANARLERTVLHRTGVSRIVREKEVCKPFVDFDLAYSLGQSEFFSRENPEIGRNWRKMDEISRGSGVGKDGFRFQVSGKPTH
jgi:hypothetical protein